MRIIFDDNETALMSLSTCSGASQFHDMNMRLHRNQRVAAVN
jgi:hypothetical protein